jgi:anaerobic magnesium-protoporphyrin IX monomethyl ester cyclase
VKIIFLSFDYLTQPLGIASLSAALVQHGHQTEVAALADTLRQEALLRDFKPDILCLSLVTGQHSLFLEKARKIKAVHPQLLILAGGPHPTFYPECIDDDCLDAVCRGEGDSALPALVDAIEKNNGLPKQLPNWWIKQPDGIISRSAISPLIENLDKLPFPDRDIFDRAVPGRLPVTTYVMTSRGCPYNCSYCFNHAYRDLYLGKGTLCRRRSVSNVIEELLLLKKRYPLQIIVFQDDTFNLDRKWLREFSYMYPREINLPFHCHLRADLLDEKTAQLLKQAGCISVKLGLEAGSDYVRNSILKRGMRLDQFENACRLLHRHNIRFATENIFAIPGTTLADDMLTYRINRSVRPHHTFATLMQVYPKTRIADYALEMGYINSLPSQFPATFYHDSAVALPDKEKRGRLRALCAIGVSLRLPLPIIKLLISLPLRRFYEFLDRLWKGYCLRFRIYPYKQGLTSFLQDMILYLRGNYY